MDRIYIIESLNKGDKNTYESLIDAIEYSRTKPKDLEEHFYSINNKGELIEVLEGIKGEAGKKYSSTIIVLDCHGNEDGLGLRSGELVLWEDINSYFIKINIQTNNNLMLFVGACCGISAVQGINFSDENPFSLLIGPNEDILPEVINSFYKGFFDALFDDELSEFLKENQYVPKDFSLITIEQLKKLKGK